MARQILVALASASLQAALASDAFGLIEFHIGDARDDPPVDKPPGYLARVTPLDLTVQSFDQFPPNVDLQGTKLDGMLLFSPMSLHTCEEAYGERPGSAPIAVAVGAAPGATQVRFDFDDPVASVGLLLLGLDVSAQVEVRASNGALLTELRIPAPAQRGSVLWLGITSDATQVSRVDLVPTSWDEYGFDDVEYGRAAPEPGSVILLTPAALLACGVRRLRRRGRARRTAHKLGGRELHNGWR